MKGLDTPTKRRLNLWINGEPQQLPRGSSILISFDADIDHGKVPFFEISTSSIETMNIPLKVTMVSDDIKVRF